MALVFRHRHRPTPDASPERFSMPPRPGPTVVTLSPQRSADVPGLQDLLGDGFDVRVGIPGEGHVSILTATSARSVAFLQARYPHTALVAFDPYERPGQPARTVELLNAGADDVVVGASLALLAAHVATVARRVGRKAEQPPGRG